MLTARSEMTDRMLIFGERHLRGQLEDPLQLVAHVDHRGTGRARTGRRTCRRRAVPSPAVAALVAAHAAVGRSGGPHANRAGEQNLPGSVPNLHLLLFPGAVAGHGAAAGNHVRVRPAVRPRVPGAEEFLGLPLAAAVERYVYPDDREALSATLGCCCVVSSDLCVPRDERRD